MFLRRSLPNIHADCNASHQHGAHAKLNREDSDESTDAKTRLDLYEVGSRVSLQNKIQQHITAKQTSEEG